MPKVEIDIYDAALLCGVACDFLYLNEKNGRRLRSDHEKIEAAKDRFGAVLQKSEEEMWKEFRKGAPDVERV